jgi:hypothetical protein
MTKVSPSVQRFWQREVSRLERMVAVRQTAVENVQDELDRLRQRRVAKLDRARDRLSEARRRLADADA